MEQFTKVGGLIIKRMDLDEQLALKEVIILENGWKTNGMVMERTEVKLIRLLEHSRE